jgi:hypothetical protein
MKAIVTKYLPASNSKGARIKASDSDGNSITVSYPQECHTELEASRTAANALCEKMNWKGNMVSGQIRIGLTTYEIFVFTS